MTDESQPTAPAADGFHIVALYDSVDEAEAAAKALVARGIGAIVRTYGAGNVRPAEAPEAAVAEVVVLGPDLARASEILGFDPPEWTRSLTADGRLQKPQRAPWKTILAIWLVAMILIPGIAFLITVNLTR